MAEAVRNRDFDFLSGAIMDKPYFRGRSSDEEIIYRRALTFTAKAMSGELEPIPETLKTISNTTQYKTNYQTLKQPTKKW